MTNTVVVLIVTTHKQYAASLLKFNFNFTVLTFGMLLKCCTKSTGWFFKAQPSEKKRRRLQKPDRGWMYPYKTVQKHIYQRHPKTRWRFGYKKTIIFQWWTCIFHIVRLMHESAATVAGSSVNRAVVVLPATKSCPGNSDQHSTQQSDSQFLTDNGYRLLRYAKVFRCVKHW